mgnify:FL=1
MGVPVMVRRRSASSRVVRGSLRTIATIPTMDENLIETTPEPAEPAKPNAASRAGAKSLKRDRKKAKAKVPKPTKKARGKVRP